MVSFNNSNSSFKLSNVKDGLCSPLLMGASKEEGSEKGTNVAAFPVGVVTGIEGFTLGAVDMVVAGPVDGINGFVACVVGSDGLLDGGNDGLCDVIGAGLVVVDGADGFDDGTVGFSFGGGGFGLFNVALLASGCYNNKKRNG